MRPKDMLKHRTTLSMDTLHRLYEIYNHKIAKAKMSYGTLLVLIDTLGALAIVSSFTSLNSWTYMTIVLLAVIIEAIVFGHIAYIRNYIVLPKKLRNGDIIVLRCNMTKTEKSEDLDLDKNGFNKYRVYLGRDEFKCLCMEEFKHLSKEEPYYFIYTNGLIKSSWFMFTGNTEVIEKAYRKVINNEKDKSDITYRDKDKQLSEEGKQEIEELNKKKRAKRKQKIRRVLKIIFSDNDE